MGRSNLTKRDLLEALGKLDLIQEELAEKLGVSQATVSRWLSGKHPIPGYVEAWLKEVLKDG